MKKQSEKYLGISTVLAFALIPLAGFATDIYIPSLPAMAQQIGVSVQAVQLSLLLFMVSCGGSQLFIGSILDSYGRYRLNMVSLVVFATASFTIAFSGNINVIYAMRIIQGITVAFILVGKRALFVDVYSGEKLKHYTSIFSIVYATAPIAAPFIGGYLQHTFGWQSNFIFLGCAILILFFMELKYTGETLVNFKPFHLKNTVTIYKQMLSTPEFALGLLILGFCYALIIVYGMASPFIIQKVYGYTAVTTGYSSLLSGVAIMAGGIISKMLINRPLAKKVLSGIAFQALAAILMIIVTSQKGNLYLLLAFTIPIHLLAGFIFNNLYAYVLRRFTQNAGVASGLTGGGIYVVSSCVGYGLIHLVNINTIERLSFINTGITAALLITIFMFHRADKRYMSRQYKKELLPAP